MNKFTAIASIAVLVGCFMLPHQGGIEGITWAAAARWHGYELVQKVAVVLFHCLGLLALGIIADFLRKEA